MYKESIIEDCIVQIISLSISLYLFLHIYIIKPFYYDDKNWSLLDGTLLCNVLYEYETSKLLLFHCWHFLFGDCVTSVSVWCRDSILLFFGIRIIENIFYSFILFVFYTRVLA